LTKAQADLVYDADCIGKMSLGLIMRCLISDLVACRCETRRVSHCYWQRWHTVVLVWRCCSGHSKNTCDDYDDDD